MMEASVAAQPPVRSGARTTEALAMRVEGLSAYYGSHKAIDNVDMVIA